MSTTATSTAADRSALPTHPHLGADDGGLRWAVRDTMAMVNRNLTGMVRLPQVLVFSLVQPIIFVLMFRYVFGGAIQVPGLDYVDYLMPGIFVQTMTFGAINTAIGLAEDKNKGLLERLRSLPMARTAVLAGRVVADSTRNVVIIAAMLAIGFAVGFRTHTNVLMVLAGIGIMLAFGFAMSWLFVLIGLSVTNGEAAQAAAFPLLAPLAFASNLFVDPDTMPGWLQPWARHQPVSVTADAVRACMLGGPTAGKVLAALAWTAGITLVLGPIGVRRFRRTT